MNDAMFFLDLLRPAAAFWFGIWIAHSAARGRTREVPRAWEGAAAYFDQDPVFSVLMVMAVVSIISRGDVLGLRIVFAAVALAIFVLFWTGCITFFNETSHSQRTEVVSGEDQDSSVA